MKSFIYWDVTQRKLVVTDVSEEPICPVFMDQEVRCLNHEDGTDRLFRNIGNDQYTLSTSQKSETLKES